MADKGGEPPVATSAVLYAAARELSSVCSRVNADYLACKAKDENPAACLAEVGLGKRFARVVLLRMVRGYFAAVGRQRRWRCAGGRDSALPWAYTVEGSGWAVLAVAPGRVMARGVGGASQAR